MVATLTLTGGAESIDFISGSELRLVRDGLQLPTPQLARITGGGFPLTQGQEIVDRQYGNREILIDFHAISPTHEGIKAALSKLQRILDYALKAQQSKGGMAGATLSVKLHGGSTAVTFDILDGEINLAGPMNQLMQSEGHKLLNNELTLIAKPYARGAVVRLQNFFVNPAFDNNIGETGRDAGYYATTGGDSARFEYSSNAGLIPPAGSVDFTCSFWAYPSGGGDEEIAIRSGPCWEITFHPGSSDLTWRFKVTDLDGNTHVAQSQAQSQNVWQHVTAVSMYRGGTVNERGIYIFINGVLSGFAFHQANTLKQDSAKFTVGAKEDNTMRFQGRIAGLAVLLKALYPWQVKLLYEYGARSLVRGNTDTPPGHNYWDLRDIDHGGIWMFDQSSGDLTDSGPYARTLTNVGPNINFTYNPRTPSGWTVSNQLTASTRYSELVVANKKYGGFAVHCTQQSGTIVGTPRINQTINIPLYKQGASANKDWECAVWVYVPTGSGWLTITSDGTSPPSLTLQVTANGSLKQYGVKMTTPSDATTITVTFGTYSGGPNDVYLSAPVLIPGNQFGLGTSWAEVTTPIPFISGQNMTAAPRAGKSNKLTVYGLPGDSPAATRIFVENPA